MHDFSLLATLAGGLSAALVLGYLTERLRLSPIVGYLAAGKRLTRRATMGIARTGGTAGNGPVPTTIASRGCRTSACVRCFGNTTGCSNALV
jgi:hypothetical protein